MRPCVHDSVAGLTFKEPIKPKSEQIQTQLESVKLIKWTRWLFIIWFSICFRHRLKDGQHIKFMETRAKKWKMRFTAQKALKKFQAEIKYLGLADASAKACPWQGTTCRCWAGCDDIEEPTLGEVQVECRWKFNSDSLLAWRIIYYSFWLRVAFINLIVLCSFISPNTASHLQCLW